MNSNTVLGKIMTLLSLTSEEEVKLAFAKLADGTLLESPTFDVGESVEVVSEDGTKTPAPDGEHELELTGAEGETVRFKIIVEGGVITERENVELEEDEEKVEELQAETVEVEPLPNTTDEDEANKVAEFSEEGEEEMEEEVTEEGEDEVTINLEDVAKKVEEMAYRIEELEKKLEEAKEEEKMEEEEEEEMEDVEDKKLDGAPVEMSRVSNTPKHISKNYHNSVLSKMYR
jgi:hypothetical protein